MKSAIAQIVILMWMWWALSGSMGLWLAMPCWMTRKTQSAERNHKPGTAEYQKVIGVNVERELGWKRFIIAHEFAHSILHYQEGRIYLHREHTKGKNADENDADYFAAALLMPRNSFRRVYTELTQKGLHKKTICSQLAREYGVPLESVTRRIEEIKV